MYTENAGKNTGGYTIIDSLIDLITNGINKKNNTNNQLDRAIQNAADRKRNEESIQAAQSLAAQVTQLPFIKGAKNKSALGNSIPYLLGEMYNTPLKLSDGFYSIAGANGYDQYYHCVLNLGFGKQKIKKIFLGEDVILEDENGLDEKTHNFEIIADSTAYNNTLEICQNGKSFDNSKYNYKVIATNDGSEIVHNFGENATPLIKQIAEYTKKLEVCIQFPALRQYNTTAKTYEERLATVRPYWSNDDGATWNEFYFSGMTDNSISLNVNHTVRFVATKEFTAAEVYGKQIKLKIVKETAKLESNSDESCYLAYYQSFCYDNKTSSESRLEPCLNIDDFIINNTTRIGVSIIANSNTNNNLEEFHTLAQAYARTWNGEAWSTTKVPTSNPAAQILEIRTSNIHNFSKYSDSEIDLESLGALYNYCVSNEFECNALLTSGIKKADLVKNILECCNAAEYINRETGKLTYAIDKIESIPRGIINAENVTNLSCSKDLSRKPDGLKVMYTSAENWQIDTFYAMINGGDKGTGDAVTDFNINYVTKYNHAYKLAQRKLRQAILQPRLFSATLGREGRKYKLFDTVHLQHPIFRQGLKSSTIVNFAYTNDGNINGLELSDYIQFESGKRYGIIINAVSEVGSQLYKREIYGNGKTRIVTLGEVITGNILPQLFNVVSVGELDNDGGFGSVTNVMKITDIEATNDGYDVILKDYNTALYEYGTIPPYRSNITRPPLPSKEIPDPSLKGLNGASGFNTRMIKLYIRSAAQPQDLPASFTQYFAHNTLDATSVQLNGWSEGGAPIDEEKNPAWFIYQTKTSQDESAVFSNDGWSVPQIDSRDTQISKSELQEMLEDLKETGAPSVYASKTFASVAVDESGRSPIDQEFTTEIHVLQSGEEIDFIYDSIVVPEGWTVSHVGNVVKFTVLQGTTVKSGTILINIFYRAFLSVITYVDEDAEAYTDESGEVYGSNVLAQQGIKYSLGFGYSEVKGGRYLNEIYGRISAISDIPSELLIGDFFTWTGADTVTQLSADTKFLKGAVYTWTGAIWKKDTDNRHLMTALDDILADANEELATNNSEAVEFFKKIVSNEVIATNLTVTGTAFMNKIIAKTVTSDAFESYDKKAQGYASDARAGALTSLGLQLDADKTIIKGSTINTGLINAEVITVGWNKLTDKQKAIIEKDTSGKTLEELGFNDLNNVTIIKDGLIITDKLKVDEITTKTINTINNGTTELEIKGGIKVTKGIRLTHSIPLISDVASNYSSLDVAESDIPYLCVGSIKFKNSYFIPQTVLKRGINGIQMLTFLGFSYSFLDKEGLFPTQLNMTYSNNISNMTMYRETTSFDVTDNFRNGNIRF